MQNDLISRSALLKELEPKGEMVSGSLYCAGIMSGIMGSIYKTEHAPAIDPESLRPKGHWNIRCHSTYDSWTQETDEEFYLECSECKREVWNIDQSAALGGKYRKLVEQFPYCHCGCKMEG